MNDSSDFTKRRLRSVWNGMKQRCYNPNATGYKNYGGRGITICSEWLDFNNFYLWAISHKDYTNEMTIERISNDIGYCPQNCTWISRAIQNKNRRNTHFVYYKGEKYTLHELSKELHFDRDCFRKWERELGNSEMAIEHLLNRRKEQTNVR